MQLANYLFFTTSLRSGARFLHPLRTGQSHGRKTLRRSPRPTEAMRGKIMHARFEGPGVLFYASDNDDAEPMRGSAHFLTMDDREQTDRLFGRLAAGGNITTPLGIQPWGDYYGKLTDRFGVQWMLLFPIASRSNYLITGRFARAPAPRRCASPRGRATRSYPRSRRDRSPG